MSWKENFREGKELILATSSENGPHANIVLSLGFTENKLLVADCQMAATIRNLENNGKICAIGGYYRIKGTAEIFSSGKYFDAASKKSKDYEVRHAILIDVKEVFDLDNVRKIQ